MSIPGSLPEDLDYFLTELQRTKTRESFDSSMKRFEESYLHRFKSSNPVQRGKFPFGTNEVPKSKIEPSVLCTPYSYLGSFYQPEVYAPPPGQFKRYEEIYNVPMHERGIRSESPVHHYTRTEYVPYPYPLHPPYEYPSQRPEKTAGSKKNPLQESMDLRRMKEEMFNMSMFGEQARASAPGFNYHEENKDGFRSFYSRK
jgi:hypothetical protein